MPESCHIPPNHATLRFMPDKITVRAEPRPPLKRCAELATGFLGWKVFEYGFAYALYPLVIWKLWPWVGDAIMAFLSPILVGSENESVGGGLATTRKRSCSPTG